MAGRDSATHTTKRVRLPRELVARMKSALAALEVRRGRYISFNEGAAEAFEEFTRQHETGLAP